MKFQSSAIQTFLPIIMLACFASARFMCAQTTLPLASVTNNFEGRLFVSEVHKDPLESGPKWKLTEVDYPPLSPAKAADIAKTYVRWRLEAPLSGKTISPYCMSINLRSTPVQNAWVYEITVLPMGALNQGLVTILVLMDGTVPEHKELNPLKGVTQKGVKP